MPTKRKKVTAWAVVMAAMVFVVVGCDKERTAVRVRIIEVHNRGDNEASFYTLQAVNTVIESVETGQRYIVPGDWGSAGDEFLRVPHNWDLGR